MDLDTAVTRYVDAWNTREPRQRRAALEELLQPGARYVDPAADVSGPAGLDALIGSVQEQFAGLSLALEGPVEAHHDVARFRWSLGSGGRPLVVGLDVLTLGGDGRVSSVVGFVEDAAAA